MAVLSKSPQCGGTQFASVGEAISQLPAFRALYESNRNTSSANNCGDEGKAELFRTAVKKEVINCGGRPTELDFFEKMAGGATPEPIDAKALVLRYNCDFDRNIYAQQPITGSGPGAPTRMRLLRSLHSGGGKYSYPALGNELYIYEDKQWVTITDKDTDNDYAHEFELTPQDGDYTVNIRQNSKILVSPARTVNGLSCPVPSTVWQTPGYTQKIRPWRIRDDWELAIDLLRGYEDILQFAVMWDNNGMAYDCWFPAIKAKAYENLKVKKNIAAFMGTKVTNPLLLANHNADGYSGFDGYRQTVEFGGGQVIDIDRSQGFDLDSDFSELIIRNDASKLSTEFVAVVGLEFMRNLILGNNPTWQRSGITFETFRRSGMSGAEEIQKLGVDSYKFLGRSIHFKVMDALTDRRFIGNHNFPGSAMIMPGNGLRDDRGNDVPPIQFFMPKGCMMDGGFEEHDRDMRKIDGCEILAGHVAETVMMATHCVGQHILLEPIPECA